MPLPVTVTVAVAGPHVALVGHLVVPAGLELLAAQLHGLHLRLLRLAVVGVALLGQLHLGLGDGGLLDRERRLGGAGVVALAGDGDGRLAGLLVVLVGHRVVPAGLQLLAAQRHGPHGRLLRLAVVGVGLLRERHLGLGDGGRLDRERRPGSAGVVAPAGHRDRGRAGVHVVRVGHRVVGAGRASCRPASPTPRPAPSPFRRR